MDISVRGKLLKRAIAKYGRENFSKEIIFLLDTEEEMNVKEKELVTEEFCLRTDTYNICVGGQGGFSYINQTGKNLYGSNGLHKNSLDAIKAGRQIQLRRIEVDKEYKEHLSTKNSEGQKRRFANTQGTFTGRKHTIESRKKMTGRNTQVGQKNSQFGTCWVYKDFINKKVKKEELEQYLNMRYIRGRCIKLGL